MNKKYIIAIDFDGTIVDHKYPEIGTLKPFAKETIQELCLEGHQIIIWTCRYIQKDVKAMVDFLNENKIPYHAINKNSFYLKGFWPKPKIYADIYIDDRNIFCEKIDWTEITGYFVSKGILYTDKFLVNEKI